MVDRGEKSWLLEVFNSGVHFPLFFSSWSWIVSLGCFLRKSTMAIEEFSVVNEDLSINHIQFVDGTILFSLSKREIGYRLWLQNWKLALHLLWLTFQW